MSNITIYHNPRCGFSRNTLGLIRNTGAEPEVIEYLLTPPSRETLQALIAQMAMPVREMMRRKEALYEELQLDNPALSDDALIDAMLAHPILINRPIVVTPLGTRLCRPAEGVLDILPLPQRGAFAKEDGEIVINERGERVVGR
ncbi:arsenate reductase [Polaromonas sp. OV174]|uniref:arsenate reductase (glutaredoxin) n=1 Tax=Polaromonas sp. OV174 TaxID=1855300 RepID=UPI0008F15946|nr:arsenate reductase (glutaredoxin) [Polaromonas sp. OV174]SFC35800.1 arsenate reductase [Polaromonas sp. OV174]